MSKKVLVAYFSADGNTGKLANNLADYLKADVAEIKAKQPYTQEDLDWQNENSRSSLEMKDGSSRPEILELVQKPEDYDVIFLGFPIWWYEAPRVILTFLDKYNLDGKSVIPFATSAGGGIAQASDALLKYKRSIHWLPGAQLRANAVPAEIRDWLSNDLIQDTLAD